jgi:ribosomal protein S18 acetylase RimI-like enzyme
MAGYDGHRGWLYSVAVDPDRQRQGIGRQLMDYAVDVLKTKGCVKINLQVRATNAGVVAFYEALGFVVEDRISMGKLLTH